MDGFLKHKAEYESRGLISLGGGLPSSEYFPFEWLEMKVPTPPHFSEHATKESGIVKRIGKHDIADGKSIYGETLSRPRSKAFAHQP